jgi:hypothetical protein
MSRARDGESCLCFFVVTLDGVAFPVACCFYIMNSVALYLCTIHVMAVWSTRGGEVKRRRPGAVCARFLRARILRLESDEQRIRPLPPTNHHLALPPSDHAQRLIASALWDLFGPLCSRSPCAGPPREDGRACSNPRASSSSHASCFRRSCFRSLS